MSASPSRRPHLRAVGAFALVALAFNAAHGAFGVGGSSLDAFNNNWLYNGLELGAALACLVRGTMVARERATWLLFGAGILAWAAGDVYYSVVFGEAGDVPSPSVADALYLTFYPLAYAALVLFVRGRAHDFSASVWLDGGIASLGAAAIGAALIFQPIVDATHGEAATIATNLAYPLADLVLLSVVIGVFTLSGRRPGRAWLLLGAGLVTSTTVDALYVYRTATTTYEVGTAMDSLWPAALLAIAWAAWQDSDDGWEMSFSGLRVFVAPAAFAAVALSLLVYDSFSPVSRVAVSLAAATLALVIGRAAWTYAENVRMLEQSRADAVTDALTALANRRRLVDDLTRACEGATAEAPQSLLMFDLDGFKVYNDTFGHLAGDLLLARLGQRLREAVEAQGAAYRLGGDEFCVLTRPGSAASEQVVAVACAALSEHGESFSVTASHGCVKVPVEATTPTQTLRMADERMYAEKARRRGSQRHQARDVLLGVLAEREPDLHEHLHQVAALANAVGRCLALDAERRDELTRAAELHDIGKAAIPDAILNKPAALDDEEWQFMRRHTLIGERILGHAPALLPVARLVRSSHEHWDGSGYPDGLTGEAIPLGARIILVCDAFHAMTSRRPYSEPMTVEGAVAELRRAAGSQFDPAVVEAFCAVLGAGVAVDVPARAG